MPRLPDPSTRQRWQALLGQFDPQHETVGAFCRRLGVSTGSYYRWRRKLSGRRESASTGAFIPVHVRPSRSGLDGSVRFRLGDRAELEVSADCEQLIVRLAQSLLPATEE